jgi:DNA-binding XRE family transcriptional regulator
MPRTIAHKGDAATANQWLHKLCNKIAYQLRSAQSFRSTYYAGQAEIAAELQIPKTTLAAWRAGRGGPSLAQAVAWSHKARVPLPGWTAPESEVQRLDAILTSAQNLHCKQCNGFGGPSKRLHYQPGLAGEAGHYLCQDCF